MRMSSSIGIILIFVVAVVVFRLRERLLNHRADRYEEALREIVEMCGNCSGVALDVSRIARNALIAERRYAIKA
jgi:hypothetical protein